MAASLLFSIASKLLPESPPITGAETMLGAITVCDFYQQQLRRFYSLTAQVSDSLEGNTLLVYGSSREKT